MRYIIYSLLAVGNVCGCSAVPTTINSDADPTPNTSAADIKCQSAGSTEEEINSLRDLIENARAAGAAESDVLSDASTACRVCLEPDVDCDATLCASCFEAIVQETFSQ